MYTVENYRSKKAVKEAIKAGVEVQVYQPGPFGKGSEVGDQTVFLEGPHYPEPHRWYGEGRLVDGVLVSVK